MRGVKDKGVETPMGVLIKGCPGIRGGRRGASSEVRRRGGGQAGLLGPGGWGWRLMPPLGRSSPRPQEGKQRLPSDCHIAANVRWMRRRFQSRTAAVGSARKETSELSQVKARSLVNKRTRTKRRHEDWALHRPGEGRYPRQPSGGPRAARPRYWSAEGFGGLAGRDGPARPEKGAPRHGLSLR